ncbi:MAG: hypothetical protein J1E16_08765 [Muribaculaceae bacterium]|nr:hypothetical protein [Muribaculaceae bacterium]
MLKKSESKLRLFIGSFALLMMFCMISLNSCGGNSTKSEESAAEVDNEEFYATQPVHSGLYDADYYNITGNNPRKGRFDGRVYISLSPKMSGLYVFENGNRTKIDYIVGLQKPFVKGEDGVYTTVDNKDKPVTINTDSTTYFLTFQHFNDTVQIGFSPKPRHTGTAIEILEKMNAQKNKNK